MRTVILFFILLACESKSKHNKNLVQIAELPKEIKESSACEISSKSDLVWTIEDQHNDPVLFGIQKNGQLKKKITITNVNNNDWEDLSSDNVGNIYIGDFGNNDNTRQNLTIYKINAEDLSKDQAEPSASLTFYFPEQKEFPPKKSERIYDVESFFYYNNAFYIFTKNRSSHFDGTTQLYRVKNIPGEKFPAEKISSYVTCNDFQHCAVTSAAISPDKTKVAILTSDKIWIFQNFTGDNFFSGKAHCYKLNNFSQKEGLCFETNTTILISDESSKNTPGKLYRFTLQ